MTQENKDTKKSGKGFLKSFVEKVDKRMKEKAAKGSSCCQTEKKDSDNHTSCCG